MVKLSAAMENARTLAAALGLPEEQAAKLLQASILITATDDVGSDGLAAELVSILSRTFSDVGTEPTGQPAIEVLIGAATARSAAPAIFVTSDGETAWISSERRHAPGFASLHGALNVLVACYAASAAAALAVPGLASPPATIALPLMDLGLPQEMWDLPVEFNDTYLAGAGAVGNGFLWTLRHFDVRGRLAIVDPDDVSEGNLNRQIWFDDNDVGKPKALKLVERAQPFFPDLRLVARPVELQHVEDRGSGPRWLDRLIVGVDSRRTRRHLQAELPREVYDASTTGIDEVVLHFNRQPNAAACLGCIYHETPRERAREQHVAESLGVSVEDVAKGRIDADAAGRIGSRYGRDPADIEGMAYDSLFKELCGQKALMVEGHQVLAPFAFVSVLAGCLLALETVARLVTPARHKLFNYWRVSPWHPFRIQQRRVRGRKEDCEVCGNPHVQELSNFLWNQ